MRQFIIISPDNKQQLVNADSLAIWDNDICLLSDTGGIICVIPKTYLVIDTKYQQIVD